VTTKVGKNLEKVHTHDRIHELLLQNKANIKDTGTMREDRSSGMLESEETRLVESNLKRLTRKIVSLPSQSDVNIPDLLYTSLESSKPADKPRKLEDKILEMHKCLTELRMELYSECLKVKENIQAKTVPLVGRNKRKYLNS
jgi:hypothetical protein